MRNILCGFGVLLVGAAWLGGTAAPALAQTPAGTAQELQRRTANVLRAEKRFDETTQAESEALNRCADAREVLRRSQNAASGSPNAVERPWRTQADAYTLARSNADTALSNLRTAVTRLLEFHAHHPHVQISSVTRDELRRLYPNTQLLNATQEQLRSRRRELHDQLVGRAAGPVRDQRGNPFLCLVHPLPPMGPIPNLPGVYLDRSQQEAPTLAQREAMAPVDRELETAAVQERAYQAQELARRNNPTSVWDWGLMNGNAVSVSTNTDHNQSTGSAAAAAAAMSVFNRGIPK